MVPTQGGSIVSLYTKFEADWSIRSKALTGVPNFLNLVLVSLATPTYGSFSGPYARTLWPVCLYQIWSGSLFSFKSYHGSPKFCSVTDHLHRCAGLQKCNQLEIVTTVPAPTGPVSWRSMHIISSYPGNEHRPPAANTQTQKHTDRTDYNTLHC